MVMRVAWRMQSFERRGDRAVVAMESTVWRVVNLWMKGKETFGTKENAEKMNTNDKKSNYTDFHEK
jgi:hypothetical protein